MQIICKHTYLLKFDILVVEISAMHRRIYFVFISCALSEKAVQGQIVNSMIASITNGYTLWPILWMIEKCHMFL